MRKLLSPSLSNTRAKRLPVAALAALSLAGCAVGPDYQRPDIDLPAQWRSTPAADADVARPVSSTGERWWAVYGDPVLERLIDEALSNNADAAIATARVLEARAIASQTDANLYPDVSANFSGSRTRNTQRGTMPAGATPRMQNYYSATLDVSYEIDLWGKYRRASEAARADIFAAESAREAVRLSLVAQVAQQYFALLAADAQVEVARRTLTSRGETLNLFTRRVEAGTLSEYELHQAVAEREATRSQLASLMQTQDRAESALSVLLGRSPREVMSGAMERGTPAPIRDVVIPAGLPSELLLRRPDLREAEEALIAANARIGSARAQFFPSIGLTAFLGSESTQFSDLFSGPAQVFQFAAAITQPIWNAGRIRAGVFITEARRDQALARYRNAVASAFKDVRDALAAQSAARETLTAETARTAALEKALAQAQLRFDAGVSSRIEVLDVERNLLSSELARIDSERQRKSALADMFKALGGGWPEPAPVGALSR